MPKSFRTRIHGHVRKPVGELLANPNNWRIHPKDQQDNLRAVLNEVGIVQTVVENITTGHLIDGHLRVQLTMREHGEEAPIDVLQVELSEQEEKLVLATLDPLSSQAAPDRDMLRELLTEITETTETISPDIVPLMDRIADDYGIAEISDAAGPPEDFEDYDETLPTTHTCPRCKYQWSGSK